MGIIKPTCSPPPPPPPPPPRDITAATRESVIVPSSRPRLSSVAPICLRRLPPEIGGTDGRAVRARRVARGTNARERVGPGLHRINPRLEERENGGNRASERGNRGNPSSFGCKASKSLQDPAPAARPRPAREAWLSGRASFGRRTAAPSHLVATSEARSRHRGAAAPPPPLRVVSLKGDQLMENE